MPSALTISRSSTPGPDDGADPRPAEQVVQAQRDDDRYGQDEDPVVRVDDAADRQRGRTTQDPGQVDGQRAAAPDREGDVVNDVDEPERGQQLGHLIALEPGDKGALQQQPEQAHPEGGGGQAVEEVVRGGDDRVADVPAEQVHRPVGQVGDPHHPEHQGETAGHQEDDPGQRQPVQGLGYELLHPRGSPQRRQLPGSGTCSPALPCRNPACSTNQARGRSQYVAGAGYTPLIIISVTTGGAARQRKRAGPAPR